MSFWSRLFGQPPPPAESPGDPDGVEYDSTEVFSRSLPFPQPSAWNGWPEGWGIGWNNPAVGLRKLIDTAWACVDTNSRILSSFPVYRLRSDKIIPPKSWMINPDDTIYNSWNEFAKQVFWDFLLGETFVLAMADGADGLPATMRVIPPWCVNAEMVGGIRRYNIGSMDVTDDILHLRYTSTTDDARGHGPLEVAGARLTTAGVLQRYAQTLAETGGVPHYWIGVKNWLSPAEANELLDGWVESRKRHVGEPGVISGEGVLHQTSTMSAKELALIELAEFSESRIAVLLGTPPALVGLPGPGGLTYANITSLFDYHDRSMLKPVAEAVMAALSNWALVRGQTCELNRDEYTRPDFATRMGAWATAVQAGIVSAEFVRKAERFEDDGATEAAAQLTGATEQPGIPRAPENTTAASPVGGNDNGE